MVSFLIHRLGRMAITVWVIATVVFIATRLTGNPIEFIMPEGLDPQSRALMISYFGLDRPVLAQYWHYFAAIFDGEFGLGLLERRPVLEIFSERIAASLNLLILTVLMTVAIGVPLGILAAIWRKSSLGSVILGLAFVGYAIPNFILSILLLLLFSYTLRWLPSAGNATLAHYIMPTLALSSFFLASLVRYTRNSMLDVLGQDYIRTARAKGLSERVVILRHGLRNALIPVITALGLQITSLVSGAVVIETVFAWNGVGDLLVSATLRRDYPVLQFGVLAVAVAVVVVNFVVDLLYAAADPRVRLAR
jgi:peptide/nickel transport system permease protein